MVHAEGIITVIFQGCTITGNQADQVSMKQPVMRRYIPASSSIQISAVAPAGVEATRLSDVGWLDALVEFVPWGHGACHSVWY